MQLPEVHKQALRCLPDESIHQLMAGGIDEDAVREAAIRNGIKFETGMCFVIGHELTKMLNHASLLKAHIYHHDE